VAVRMDWCSRWLKDKSLVQLSRLVRRHCRTGLHLR